MENLQPGDKVTVNNALPLLEGETGTVTNPDYIGYVIIKADNEELQTNHINCFLPEELTKQ